MADDQPPVSSTDPKPESGESIPPQGAAPGDTPVPPAETPNPSSETVAAPEHVADLVPSSPDEQAAIDELLKQAAFEDPSAVTELPSAPEASTIDLPNFQQVIRDAQVSSIDLLRDVELNVKIELGRSRMLVEDVLKLGEGSVVELDKLAGDPVDVFVNDRLVARGEVLVLNDNFCVRVNEIVAGTREENP
jgi:flagellar motor switch protein FliN/FliY